MNHSVKVLGSVLLASVFAAGCGVSDENKEVGAPDKKVLSVPSGGFGGGSAASVGGATAGVGGATAGMGGATSGMGGAVAGVGGSTAGVGGGMIGIGGAMIGVGGGMIGVGGQMAGVGGDGAASTVSGAGGATAGVGGATAGVGGATSGAGGATTGAGGATSGAGGAGEPLPRVQVPCGGIKQVKQGDKRTLYASAVGATEAQAKAKCEVASWWAGVSGYECTVATSCPTTPYPHCSMYFGPDTFVTKECTCQDLTTFWSCYKEGEIPVGSAVECFSCYQTTLKVPCGQKVKLPATMSGVVEARGYSDVSEQKAKEECEKAEWYIPGIWCERPANDTSTEPTPRPKYTVQNESQCSCEKVLVSPDRWECKRTAVMVNNSDIDCTACAPKNP